MFIIIIISSSSLIVIVIVIISSSGSSSSSNNSNMRFDVKGKTQIPTNYPSSNYPFSQFGNIKISTINTLKHPLILKTYTE